ncbi:hypothetical protein HDV06_005664 [Boothiomyces sp. JEL0866]|nr:hypothetical protein HDV06_005664 [Boothiomyces sp. JEL0866]
MNWWLYLTLFPATLSKTKCGTKSNKNPHYSVLETVPLPRLDYTATYNLKTAYKMPDSQNQTVLAGMEISTKHPTISVANYPHIVEVVCLKSEIQLVFDDSDHIQEAFTQWSATPSLALFINHELQCHGADGVSSYMVSNISRDDLKLLIDFEVLHLSSLVQNYTLDIVLLKNHPNHHSKRDFWDWFRWSHDAGFSQYFGINYDSNSQSVIQQTIPIYSDNKVEVDCLNCYANGTVGIHATVRGLFLVIESYQIDFIGDLNTNIDVGLNIAAGTFEYRKKLFALQLLSVGIPNLFSFGPGIELDAAVTFQTQKDIDIAFGFDYSIPLQFSIGSGGGIFGTPSITAFAKSSFNAHPLKISQDVQVSVAAHLIPMINLDLKVLFMDAFQIGVEFDNQIGLEYDTNSFGACPESGKNMILFDQNDINFYVSEFSNTQRFNLFTYHTNLWNKCTPSPTTVATTTSSSITTTTLPSQTIETTTSLTATTTVNSTSTELSPTITKVYNYK